MIQTHPSRGALTVVPPATLEAALQAQDRARADAKDQLSQPVASSLAGHIRTQFDTFKQHRNNAQSGWTERLLSAMRAFNGTYEPSKLADIEKFGGSKVYARIIAMKCRGTSSLLRDVYLAPNRPWGISPPADPTIPQEVVDNIKQLVQVELATTGQAGEEIGPEKIRDRINGLMESARMAAKKRASDQAKIAQDKIDELLQEGNFYKALAEFIVDLPLFPFACIKGPVVRIVPGVVWNNGNPIIQQKPKLFWQRVSPFDLWWTPGVADIESAEVIERTRLTRAELNDLLDLPGYNHDEVRAVLDEYGRGGIADNWDNADAERAVQESRENPQFNRSGMITCLEYHGNIQGRMLHEYGMSKELVPDELRDYMVQAWLIGNHVIKAQLSPSPRKRHPYFITSFEKVPGTPVGNGLPDILSDIQEVCNATLRSLVNNLSIASGPQVIVNDDRLAAHEDGEELYPWKRWHTTDPAIAQGAKEDPIKFFQPRSNAQELLAVYKDFSAIADELSAIPKYLAGQGAGGAGRTASGLAMLMGNASKILQTVAANIDRDIFDPLLSQLFDMLMLTDSSGLLTGEETVRVMGVNVAVQRETERSRQLEFLQTTANPIDAQIMGPKGRAAVLRSVAKTIGMDDEEIVPTDEQLQSQAADMAAAGALAQGGQQPGSTNDMGPRTRIAGGVG